MNRVMGNSSRSIDAVTLHLLVAKGKSEFQTKSCLPDNPAFVTPAPSLGHPGDSRVDILALPQDLPSPRTW